MVGLLVTVNSVAAAFLLVAGAAKLVSPDPLRAALAELAGGHRIPRAALRAFALLEIVTAVGLTVAAVRIPAAVVSGLLGACFVAAGALGGLRGSTAACGCLGTTGGGPLGLWNVLAGVAFLLVPAVNTVADTGGAHGYFRLTATCVALGAVLFTLAAHRDLIKEFTRPVRVSSS